MKDKLKRISALLCAVCFTALSLAFPASAETYVGLPNTKNFTYFNYLNEEHLLKFKDEESLINYFDINANIHIPYSNGSGDKVSINMSEEKLFEGDNWITEHYDYGKFVHLSREKSSSSPLYYAIIYYYNPSEAEIVYSDDITNNFVLRLKEGIQETEILRMGSLSIYKHNEGSYFPRYGGSFAIETLTKDRIIESSSDVSTLSYDSSLTIYDENGEVILDKNPSIEVFYEYKDGNHVFVVNSPEKLALSFDFCEYDSEYSYNFGQLPIERLEKHQTFDINTLNPLFRYNEINFTSDVKTKKKYTFEEMCSLEDDNIKIAWWIDFFTNDEYSKNNGKTNEVVEQITALLLDTDNFYNYEFKIWETYNKLTPSYSNFDYVWNYLRDNIYNEWETQQLYDCYIPELWEIKYRLPLRVEEYTAELSVDDERYSKCVYYKGYATHIGIAYSEYIIPDSYLEYKGFTNYAWVVSYQPLEEVEATNETDLTDRKFADYFIYSSKIHVNLGLAPYGDGITNNKALVFESKDSNNIIGELDENNQINTDVSNSSTSTNNPTDNDFNINMNFDTTSPEALFNSCTNFFDFLKMGFSILPAFIWSLIATVIVVIIFLRVIGR